MGNAYSDIASLCISVLTLYIFYSRGRISARQTRVFQILLYATLGASLLSLFRLAVYYTASETVPTAVMYLVNIVYFSALNCLPPLLTWFIINTAAQGQHNTMLIRGMFSIPWTLLFCAIASSPWTGFMFSLSGDGVYRTGPGYPLFYAMALFYIAFVLYFLVVNKHLFDIQIRKSVLLFLPFSLVPAFLHIADQTMRLQILGMAFSELIIIMTFLDTSPLLDGESGLLNREGFISQSALFTNRHSSFTALLVYIDTIDFIRQGLGTEEFSKFQTELCYAMFGFPGENRFAARIGTGSYIQVKSGRNNTAALTEKLHALFASPWKTRGAELRLSARFCIIRYPEDTGDTNTIIGCMYRLSRRWQHFPAQTVLSFSDLMETNHGRYLDIQQALRRGFLNNGFELYFQPIVSANSGKTVSAEALIRLRDSALGWISPAEFIPAAEESGSIHRIGDWVIETACLFLARLDSEQIPLQDLEINLSSLQCIQSKLAPKLRTITEQYGIAPARLCLEITETASGYSRSRLRKNMEELAAAGYPVAIDDFGTGFANLSNLLTISFSRIKFDKSLIDTLTDASTRNLGLEYLVHLFKTIGTTMIAEGVETEEEVSRVRAMGIDLIQGYYYSRPLAPADFIAYMRAENAVCM